MVFTASFLLPGVLDALIGRDVSLALFSLAKAEMTRYLHQPAWVSGPQLLPGPQSQNRLHGAAPRCHTH